MYTFENKKVLSLPIQTQYFPFFPTFMNYILQNASPELLLKLYQCCKYFYLKSKITIAQNVRYENYLENKRIEFFFYEKEGFLSRSYSDVQKLWLTDKLHISSFAELGINGNEFLNKIFRNDLKMIFIRTESTLFKELEILSESPNLTEIEIASNVKSENGEPNPIEEIMVLFPNIKKFEICPPYFTLESFQKLSKIKFSNKFQRIAFRMIKTQFDPITLCSFLKDNVNNNLDLYLTFGWDFDHLKLQLIPQIKEILNGWEKKKIKHFYF
uniref:Maturase K n=1 Tax=Panagrolaimus davidi TaxID=227884 RepID=A0A914QE93_9BILA